MGSIRLIGAAVSAALGLLATAAATPVLAGPAPLATGLREIAAAYDRGVDVRTQPLTKLSLFSRSGDPMVRVRLQPGADADKVLAHLAAMGFRLQIRSTINPSLMEGYLPLASLHHAQEIAGIHSLHASMRPKANVGLVTSQAVALEKADLAQARGVTGKGMKIAALSDSFDDCDFCSDHAADNIRTNDLPRGGVFVLPGQDHPEGGGVDEGRAMLQLIHDIAPDAKLGFATAFISELQFSANILNLRAQFGADVICDDTIYFDEPMYSDGILAQTVDIVSQQGAAYFSSALNNGAEAYEATYEPIPFEQAAKLAGKGIGNIHLEQIPPELRPLSVHNFGHGRGAQASIANPITSADAGGAILDFQWDEPFDLGRVKTDYNIYVFDANGNWIVPDAPPDTNPTVIYTTDNNLETDQAIELAELFPVPGHVVGAVNTGDYQIVIGSMNGGPAKHIKYVAVNTLAVSEQQFAPSTWGHAAARGGIGVAAMYYPITNFPEDFSSPGPVTIYFDTEGRRLREPEVRLEPQLTAADGVDTTFFPPGGIDPDGTGFPNFFGTSAAAPDAAAVAALVLESAGGPGSLSPRRVYERLEQTATRIPVPNVRGLAGAFAGPITFSINRDWTRFTGDFSLEVSPLPKKRSIASITFDTSETAAGLTWSQNHNRFSVSNARGVAFRDMAISISPDSFQFTIAFARGSFGGKASFDFGESVFTPIQGSTQEDPDRFRNMKVIVTLDDGQTFTGRVFAEPKLPINNYTGFGLVNADLATR
ncbi:MAG TPA: S8 family serine peptidase [Steroidobacteraceae bacterium]|nr:S8 family serine peptidase [Steroidobacteraceae bacterium]